jgi:hypothetical protein
MATVQSPVTSSPRKLTHADLPDLFLRADEASVRNQKRYVQGVRVEAIMLVVAALTGLLSFTTVLGGLTVNIFSVAAAVAFGISFLSHIVRWLGKPSQRWYAGRAIAESSKTICWRYAVGSEPFNKTVSDDAAAVEFQRQFEVLRDQAQKDHLNHTVKASVQISPTLHTMRQQPLAERQAAYLEGRLQDQYKWYSKKAATNQQAANFWGIMMLLLEGAGAVLAGLHFFNLLPINLLGVIGTATAAVGTWLQLKQHQMLAQSYSVAAKELELIIQNMPQPKNTPEDETIWAKFVDDAETAISREHTLWVTAHANAVRPGGPRAL